jgi:hypothetical protein
MTANTCMHCGARLIGESKPVCNLCDYNSEFWDTQQRKKIDQAVNDAWERDQGFDLRDWRRA